MFTISLVILAIGCVNGWEVSSNGKIVGGYPVNITDYPYQVLMLKFNYPACGGSIISADWVLSAAHCINDLVQNNLTDYITFRAGSTYKDYGGEIYNSINVILHPKYNASTFDYDFALIKVSPPFNFNNPGIKRIKVGMIEPPPGTIVTVSGWGVNATRGWPSPNLLAADVNIVKRSECNASYSGYLSNSMICAAAVGKDSCQGDSGGPLAIRSTNTLIGIVSWGVGCALPDYPGIYSSTAVARIWIYRLTGV